MRTTPIDRAKAGMGYQTATQRPCCRNCYHSKQDLSGMYPWYCSEGLFGTTAQAVCDQHQPHQKGSAT